MTRVTERPFDGGRSYWLETEHGQRVVVAIHDTGVRELHLYSQGSHEPNASVRLDDDDARRLGAVLSGSRFRPALPPSVKGRLGKLVLDWIRVEPQSAAVGQSLGQFDLHRRTGMTVIAIVRGDTTLVSPGADEVIEADDRVVVIGQLRQLSRLLDVLAG